MLVPAAEGVVPGVAHGARGRRLLRGAARGGAEAAWPTCWRPSALNGAGSRTVGTYSGGMVQRLGLAVAMLPDAPIMLLDEPTAALDPDGLCAFYALVERHAAEGRTRALHLAPARRRGAAGRPHRDPRGRTPGRATSRRRELVQRLADRGVMRVRLDGVPGGAAGAVQRAGARRARWAGDDCIVPGPGDAPRGRCSSEATRPAREVRVAHRRGRPARRLLPRTGRRSTHDATRPLARGRGPRWQWRRWARDRRVRRTGSWARRRSTRHATTRAASAACRCRDTRFAAQLVAPGEEPVFFDDLGCLTHYRRRSGDALPPGRSWCSWPTTAPALGAARRRRCSRACAGSTRRWGRSCIAHADDAVARRPTRRPPAGSRWPTPSRRARPRAGGGAAMTSAGPGGACALSPRRSASSRSARAGR